MKRIILWSSLVLTLSAFALSCAKADKLDNRVSELEKEVAALEESVGRFNSNAHALHMVSSGSRFLKEVVRHDYGYALEFTDGTSCKVFFGSEAPSKDPLLSIDEDGSWLVSMDGGTEFLPIEGASNAYAQDGVTPQFRVQDGLWQVSADAGLSWVSMPGNPSSVLSFFRSVVYDEAKGVLTLVLGDGKEVSVCIAAPCSMEITGYQAGDVVRPGNTYRYDIKAADVAEVIPRLPSGWTLEIKNDIMTISVPSSAQAGEAVLTMILVSDKGLVTQKSLLFTIVLE